MLENLLLRLLFPPTQNNADLNLYMYSVASYQTVNVKVNEAGKA